MKELTIEEKAARYDEAINIARKINSGEGVAAPSGWTTCEVIFPELKESEDEKIRKALLRFHKSTIDIDGIKGGDILAWLEKQGEHANFRNKIQIGDKVTRNEDDVLVNMSQLKRVAKPADKIEQKHIEWSEEDERERKHCVDFLNYPDMIEATPTVVNGCKDWLKSLKDRVQLKQEWSEEDEKTLKSVITNYESGYLPSIDKRDEIIKKLKTLKLKKQWKPSKEQMEALWNVYEGGEKQSALASLYNDLKKLKE